MRKRGNPSKQKPNSHLLILNYCLDEDNQVLSHQAEIALELAKKFQRVTVITGYVGSFLAPENMAVISLHWKSRSSLKNLRQLIYYFLRVCLFDRPIAIFSHMTENYTLATGLFSRILGVKHVLWYAHTSGSFRLKIASLLANLIVTSTSGSFPFKSRKVLAIGQSIRSDLFLPREQQPQKFEDAIHVGRIDPSKNLDLIISCFLKRVDISGKLTIVGKPSNAESTIEWEKCKSKFENFFESGRIIEVGTVARKALPDNLVESDFFLHAFIGSLDKAIVEATFCKVPVVTVNPEYIDEFGTWSQNNDALTLEMELMSFFAIDESERIKLINERYSIALDKHSFTSWVGKLKIILESDYQEVGFSRNYGRL